MSPATVSRIFDQLKTEGVLRGAWGSKTILEAAQLDRKLRIRGLIALLIPLELFVDERASRKIIANLSLEVWKLGFASHLWPYDATDMKRPAFLKNLVAEKPDAIFWFMPSSLTTELANKLVNCGIPIIRLSQISIELTKTALARHLDDAIG